jgi:hypothetical protein
MRGGFNGYSETSSINHVLAAKSHSLASARAERRSDFPGIQRGIAGLVVAAADRTLDKDDAVAGIHRSERRRHPVITSISTGCA